MKTKREIAENQIRLQEEIQSAGVNLVTCGNCGSILLHDLKDETIECFCGSEMDLHDCPDYWYEGVQEHEEFNLNDKLMNLTPEQKKAIELYKKAKTYIANRKLFFFLDEPEPDSKTFEYMNTIEVLEEIFGEKLFKKIVKCTQKNK